MPYLTYNTLFDFLAKLPAADSRYYYEEIQSVDVPLNWKHLGSLNDDKINMAMEVYKPGSHYAIGFYPFNGCDIYQDEQGRVLLSYLEFGGHLPFRRSFIATKVSPFIVNPICFKMSISDRQLTGFMELMLKHEVTKEIMEMDLSAYRNVFEILEDIKSQRPIIMRRYFDDKSNETRFTIIASRDQAHQICAFNR